MNKLGKLLVISRIAKKTGNNGLSKKDQERLFAALIQDVGEDKVKKETTPVKKSNLSNFVKVADEIMQDSPGVTNEYKRFVEKWVEPYASGAKPLIFSQYQSFSQTAWFRALTNDNLHTMQNEGVQKVQILAYMDDRTTEICQSMHGRVFEIGSYSIDPDTVVHERIETMGIGSAPTKQMRVMLPPYHYNCRTTFVEFIEPSDEMDKIKQKVYDVEHISKKDIEAITESLKGAQWLNKAKEIQHYNRHGAEMNLSKAEYQQQIIDSLQNNDNMYLAINRGNKNLTLATTKYHHVDDDGVRKFLFTQFLVKDGKVITSHLKPEEKILPRVSDDTIKVVSIAKGKQKVVKGVIMKKDDKWNDHNSYDRIITEIEDNKKWGNYPMNCLVTWYKDVPNDIIENEYFVEEISRDIPARYDIHTLLMNDYTFTKQELNLIERTDRKLLNNVKYYLGKVKVVSSDELFEFFEWLTDAKETESRGVLHTHS